MSKFLDIVQQKATTDEDKLRALCSKRTFGIILE